MLDLKLLTTFREVAVRGSFSDAAVALDFTQPAVSQHISRLEATLGTRVLERSARGVTLTPAGEVLVRHASALLDAARRAEEAVRDAAGIGRAQVRVGAFPSAAAGPAAGRHARAARAPAGRRADAAGARGGAGARRAARRAASTSRRSSQSPLSPSHAAAGRRATCRSATTRCGSRSPPTTRWPRARRSRSRSCCDEPFLITEVAGTCADSNVVLNAFRDAGFEPNVRFASDDYQALQGMAASGIGVALIPTLALVSSRSDVVVLPLRGRAPARQIVAAVRDGRGGPARRAHDRVAARARPRTLAGVARRSSAVA